MAPPIAAPIRYGRVFGTVYDYNAGDVLEIHTHEVSNNHITIVTNGMLRVIGPNHHEGKVLSPGQVIAWEANVPHGLEAVTDARMINLLTHDKEVSGNV